MSAIRRCGWVADPLTLSADDWSAEEVLKVGPAPERASLAHHVHIIDQGGLGSCVANAALQAIRISHLQQGSDPAFTPFGSRLFVYFFARALHGATNVDSGTWLRALYEMVNRFGFPPETAWPYSDDTSFMAPFTRMPSKAAVRLAFDQRGPAEYRRIYDQSYARVDAVKRAIAQGFAVTFGTDVSNDFVTDRFDASSPLDPPRGDVAGGHAMCIVGYDGDVFTVANSYGERWGDRGFFCMSPDYLADVRTRDLWIVQQAPIFSELT